MNAIKNLIVGFIVLFSTSSYAETYCESFSSVQLKEHYNANFLNKDMRGCFEIYFNEHKSEISPNGTFSVEFGNHVTSITEANAAKISYATFTSIGNYRTTSKKLSDDTDEVLRTIRYEADLSSKKIDQDLLKFRSIYNVDGVKSIQENSNQINNDLESLKLKIKDLKRANAEISSVPTTLLNPDLISELQKNTSNDPIDKEKDKWQNSKNNKAIPFHTLKKIYKGNPDFGSKVLEEIKYARYMEMGLLKSTSLPLLDQVQKYESKTNTYNAKYDFAKKSLSENDQYLKEKKFALTASYELKKIADSKLIQGDLNKANDGLDMATLALDITTSLPMAATGRGLYEFFSGKSLLTNRDLSNFERGASLSIALIDLMPAAWIANGVRGAWLIGELGTRLVERGLIKAGFEDALNIGVDNAKLISEGFQELLASGSAKLETIKRVIKHKLFFSYLSQETYLASKAFQKDIIAYEKSITELVATAGKQEWSAGEISNVIDVYSKAPGAKIEIDNLADDIANSVGGKVAKAPLKSPSRTIEKITLDYKKDATQIKDIARNTIIVDGSKIDNAVVALEKNGAKVKRIEEASNPLGYSGVNANIMTQEGITAEIQVNTPEMIYGKENESIARILLGDETYNNLSNTIGISGGKGHEYYEQWRILPDGSPARAEVEKLSKSYYEAIRRAVNNGHN